LKSTSKNKKDQEHGHEEFLDSDTDIDVEELKGIFQGKLDNLERKVELILQLKEEFLKEELVKIQKSQAEKFKEQEIYLSTLHAEVAKLASQSSSQLHRLENQIFKQSEAQLQKLNAELNKIQEGFLVKELKSLQSKLEACQLWQQQKDAVEAKLFEYLKQNQKSFEEFQLRLQSLDQRQEIQEGCTSRHLKIQQNEKKAFKVLKSSEKDLQGCKVNDVRQLQNELDQSFNDLLVTRSRAVAHKDSVSTKYLSESKSH